jgi:hypothetical protein
MPENNSSESMGILFMQSVFFSAPGTSSPSRPLSKYERCWSRATGIDFVVAGIIVSIAYGVDWDKVF